MRTNEKIELSKTRMNLQKIIKQTTFDKIVLFFSITTIVGLYYEQYLYLIKPAYALLIVGFVRKLFLHKNLIFFNYIFLVLAFLLLAFLSTVWSFNQDHTIEYFSNLLKAVILSILIINLCDSKDNANFALFSLAFSGLIFGLLYILNFDVSSFGANRISVADPELEGLPNENIVSILAGFSFAYFIIMYFLKKNKTFFILALLVILIIIILGSRKTILNAILAILFLVWKLEFRKRFTIIIFLVLLIGIVSIYVPKDYTSFVIERFLGLSSIESMGEGDQERVDLFYKGLDFISENPILGHGYYNFEKLYLQERGILRYSHNNYIETLVGLGLVGFCLFYSLYFIIIKRLHISKNLNYSSLLFALCILNLFDHFTIVVTNLKFTWILIAILFAASRVNQKDIIEKRYI